MVVHTKKIEKAIYDTSLRLEKAREDAKLLSKEISILEQQHDMLILINEDKDLK